MRTLIKHMEDECVMQKIVRWALLSSVAAIAVALAFSPLGLTAMPKSKKPPPVARYCQQAISGHPHHKHVLVDNQTGDVTWTFHNGSTLAYSSGPPMHRAGTLSGPVPHEFTHDRFGRTTVAHDHLGRFSDKLRTWCLTRGAVPRLSPKAKP